MEEKDTPMLQGYQVFHNYIGGHGGPDGKTPAEACRITIKGNNGWLTHPKCKPYHKPAY